MHSRLIRTHETARTITILWQDTATLQELTCHVKWQARETIFIHPQQSRSPKFQQRQTVIIWQFTNMHAQSAYSRQQAKAGAPTVLIASLRKAVNLPMRQTRSDLTSILTLESEARHANKNCCSGKQMLMPEIHDVCARAATAVMEKWIARQLSLIITCTGSKC